MSKSYYKSVHQPCADCGSSDALATYYNGNSYCFSCKNIRTNKSNVGTIKMTKVEKEIDIDVKVGSETDIIDRGITRSTCKTYGVTRGVNNLYFPYYDEGRSHVANKVRSVDKKKFSSQGAFSNSTLFGQNLFSGGRFVTITEGEIDALSCYQILGSKWPVLSIKSGAQSAVRDVTENYDYLNQFDNVIICFDNDEYGRSAAKDVAELLAPKAKIMHMNLKDANEYLKEGKQHDFIRLWWDSEQYTPDGIISGVDLWDKIKVGPPESAVTYPYTGLNKLTYGIRMGELVTIASGSGLGKSSFLREIVFHILSETDSNVGLMFLEESVRRTAQAIIGLDMNKPIHLPNVDYTDIELKSGFDNTLGTNRLFFFDHFGSNTINNIISRIRYMVRAQKCKYIFLDHISILVSDQTNMDERKALDEIMTKLRTLVQELDICMFVASHLKRVDYGHEEGGVTKLHQLRGSGSIGQLSDIVIGLERDGQAVDMRERHTTTIRVIKNRFSGLTGPANMLLYDLVTGRLSEVSLNHETDLASEDF